MTLDQRLIRIRATIMSTPEWAFLGSVIMTGPTIITDEVSTAATDGYRTFFNPSYVTGLNDQEFAFLVIHEALHKAYRHCSADWERILRPYNKDLANMAMDFIINGEIIGANARHPRTGQPLAVMPQGGLYNQAYVGCDTVRVYRDLLAQQQKSDGGAASSLLTGRPLDDHIFDTVLSEDEKKDIAQAINQAVAAGGGLSPMARRLAKLATPKIDWRAVLRAEWQSRVKGKDVPNWTRPHAAYRALGGLYYPSLAAATPPSVTLCVDVSGSVGEREFADMMTEIAHLVRISPPQSLSIVWWHDAIDWEQYIPPEQYDRILDIAYPRSSGGTNPECLREHLGLRLNSEEHVVAVLTDGHFFSPIDLGDDVIWVITPGGDISYIRNGVVVEM